MKKPLKETVYQKLSHFLNIDLWIYPLKEARGWRYFFFKIMRTLYIAVKSFYKDHCFLRAPALTFFTTMSIVPFLSMSFAITEGFGYRKHLEEELYKHFSDQQDVINQVIAFSENFLHEAKGGIIAGIGLIIFFWSVLKVLHHIESSFNQIWKVCKSRSWLRKFSDYLAIMIVGPLVFALAGSITVFIVSKLQDYIANLPLYETVSFFLLFLLKIFPYCLIWMLFTFLYLFMPNSKVRFFPAFFGGVLAGTVYQFVQWGYIYFQIGMSRYNAVYGSFAAVPLFLIWLNLSWLIVLFGSEISYGYQNVNRYEYSWRLTKLGHRLKILLCLWIVHQAVIRFLKKEDPITKEAIFEKLELPYNWIESLIDELSEIKLLSCIKGKRLNDIAYQPAFSVENLKIKEVIDIIEKNDQKIPEIRSPTYGELISIMNEFGKLVKSSDKNVLIKDLL